MGCSLSLSLRGGVNARRQPCDHDSHESPEHDADQEALKVASLEALAVCQDLVFRERVGNQIIVLGVHPREHPVDHFGSFVVCGRSHLPLRSD